MPKANVPPIATRFKPGVSGNPGGRPKYWLTPEKIREILSRLLNETEPRLRDMLGLDSGYPASDKWVASIIIKGIENGDASRFAYLLDRAIGKVKEAVDRPDELEKIDMTPEQRNARIAELLAKDGPPAPTK